MENDIISLSIKREEKLRKEVHNSLKAAYTAYHVFDEGNEEKEENKMVEIVVYHKNIITGAGIHSFKAIYNVPAEKVEDEIAFFEKIGVKAERRK